MAHADVSLRCCPSWLPWATPSADHDRRPRRSTLISFSLKLNCTAVARIEFENEQEEGEMGQVSLVLVMQQRARMRNTWDGLERRWGVGSGESGPPMALIFLVAGSRLPGPVWCCRERLSCHCALRGATREKGESQGGGEGS